MKALSKITALPGTSDEITTYVEAVKIEFMASSPNEQLNIWRQLKAFASVIKEIEGDLDIKNTVLESAQGNGKTFEITGARFTIKNITKWDYTVCNDNTLNSYEKQLKDLKERISIRQKMLQNLTSSVKDGENEIFPPSKINDETLSVTIL